MIILPTGVTGFFDSQSGEPPLTDLSLFQKLCYSIAAESGGRVLAFESADVSTNFAYAQIKWNGDELFVLLNEHSPYLAMADAIGFGGISFVDRVLLREAFSPYYNVLETGELNTPIEPPMIQHLNRAERAQISYWKPKTVGELVFHYWD